MSKKLKIVAILLALVLVGLAVYFIWVRPAFENAISGENGRVLATLFDRRKRDQILSFQVRTFDGEEYTIGRVRTSYDPTDADVDAFIQDMLAQYEQETLTAEFLRDKLGYKKEGLEGDALIAQYRKELRTSQTLKDWVSALATFYLTQDGITYSWLTVSALQLSNMVASAGSVSLYNIVATTDPSRTAALEVLTEAEYAERLKRYGLDGEGTARVDVTLAEKDASGKNKVLSVLVGDKDATGQGYYVTLEGGNIIGTTNTTTLGGLLSSPAAAMVDCQIIAPLDNNYAYAYADFLAVYDTSRIYAGTALAGSIRLKAGDTVGITYTMEVDGKQMAGLKMYNLPLDAEKSDMEQAFIDLLIDKTLGKCDIPYQMKMTVQENGSPVEKTVTIRISSIDYISYAEAEKVTVGHVGYDKVGDGADKLFPLETYRFLSPKDICVFLPNTDTVITALENIAGLEGTTVSLGLLQELRDEEGKLLSMSLNTEIMEKYGLWRHRIVVRMPYYGGIDPMENAPVDYTESVLYISDLQADGSYYVGSVLYNLVARVDAEQVDFVEYTLFDWTERGLLKTKVDDIVTMTFVWNYGSALSGTYTLSFRPDPNDEDHKRKIVTVSKDGQTLLTIQGKAPYKNFSNFFMRFLYMEYQGDLPMTKEEISATVADPAKAAMQLSILLSDGQVATVRLFPYAETRVLAEVNGTAAFYIYTADLKTTAANFLHLLRGEDVPPQGWYGEDD